MRAIGSKYLLSLAFANGISVQAQEPLIPLWQHVDPFGAGSLLASADVLSTRISHDPSTGLIYRAIFVYNGSSFYRIQVFDEEGNDLTPASPIILQGIPIGDYQAPLVIQLSAANDTLSAIVRGEVYFGTAEEINYLKVQGTDGSPYFLLGCGSTPLNSYHHDANGTLLLMADELRKYSPTNWPDGSITVSQAAGLAVLGNDVLLGAPPSFSRIDRSSMTAASPITVPSSGVAASGMCIANGGSAFNYAALNSNGIMDVGLVDINSGVIWNTTISVPGQARPTAYHIDAQGDFWVAIANNATGVANLGLLYRFHSTSGLYGVNSFSRRIDGIESSNGRLFLTGRQAGSSVATYLAAFDADLITEAQESTPGRLQIVPNPSSSEFRLVDVPSGTSRMSITDATGRIVRELKGPFTTAMSVSVSDLPNGTYLLSLFGGDSRSTRSFGVLH